MTLDESVIATLRYSDYFNYPLTFTELFSRLISEKVSHPQLKQILSKLLKSKKIGLTNGFYHLASRQKIISLRRTRAALSRSLLMRAELLIDRLKTFPGIVAIYLTGSLAVANTDGNDDIDLMVITKNGRLWTTRFWLTLYTTLLGLRRTPSSHNNSGKLCLNLYLTPASLLLPTEKQNLYTAYELIQTIPLYDPHHTHSSLLASNSWIIDYLPNFPLPKSKTNSFSQPQSVGITEKFLYTLQKTYMSARMTREYITINSAFFHPTDPGKNVLRKLAR